VLPKSLGDERASFRREFDQAYAPVVRILASQKRFFLQAIDRDTDRSRRETYFGTRDVIAQLRRRLLRCQVRRSFSTRPTYQELRFWNIGIFNDPPMRPRFELGVDTTEYWGSTKKFTTVPVGRVHTLPVRFSTDLHGLFTELRVEIRDTSRCRTPVARHE